jgi:hypothetical protein
MGWKIIAFIYAFFFLWGVFDASYYETAPRMVGGVLFFFGIIGLFLFAFNKRTLPQRMWKSFTIVYVAYAAFGLLSGAKALIVTHGVWTFLLIVAVSVVFQFPVVRGLWWLSFAPTESGSRHLAAPRN